MRIRLGIIGLALCALAWPAPSVAEGGNHLANEPAATLLLPYFEVALPKKPNGKQKGTNTIFTVTNAEATATLAHVTLWSDLSVPLFVFDVYLTGYDVQTIDLFEVLAGRLPQSASDGQDPTDTISQQGPVSQDINFASCNGILPYPPQLPEATVAHMRAALTGEPSPLDTMCFGRNYDEKKPIARGYVTVDTVNSCNALFPGDINYFGGVSTDQNNLFGDWFIADRVKKTLYGDSLVHIRADAIEFAPGDYTFYGRFVGATPTDHRQPLATNWVARFANDPQDPLFPGGTSMIAWRDVKLPQSAFACAAPPAFLPLAQEQIVAWDEEEQVEEPTLPLPPFPGATQKIAVGGPELPVSFARGFLLLNLNHTVAGQTTNPGDPAAAQSVVTTVRAGKKQRVAIRGVAMDHANDADHTLIPVNN